MVSLGAALAFLCLIPGSFSLMASLRALPAGNTLDLLRQGQPVSEEDAAVAARASYAAAQIFEPARYGSNALLAAAQLSTSQQKTAGLGTQDLLALVDDALGASPASPHNWARRAALLLSAGRIDEARRAIEMSVMVGRFVPRLTVPRLRIILRVMRPSPDPAFEAMFAAQVRLAALSEPRALAAFADGGQAEGLTQVALMDQPDLYAAYLRHLRAWRAEAR